MSEATVVFAFVAEMATLIAYDTTPPIVPDQAHAGPRLNRSAAAPAVRREAEGPALNREAAATLQTGSTGPTISREAR